MLQSSMGERRSAARSGSGAASSLLFPYRPGASLSKLGWPTIREISCAQPPDDGNLVRWPRGQRFESISVPPRQMPVLHWFTLHLPFQEQRATAFGCFRLRDRVSSPSFRGDASALLFCRKYCSPFSQAWDRVEFFPVEAIFSISPSPYIVVVT